MLKYLLALVIGASVITPAYAQLKPPHVTGDLAKDLKDDAADLRGANASPIARLANGQVFTCDSGTFTFITPKNIASVISQCGEKLLADSQAALDSATASKDQVAIACLTPGTALIKAGVGTPGVPGNPNATPPVPDTPAQLCGPLLLFQKFREFVNAGGISACSSWVNTVVAAQVGSAAGVVGAAAGAAVLLPKP